MNNFRWLNPTQPQTLHSAVILAYFRGFSIVFLGSVYYRQLAYDILGRFAMQISPLVLLVALVGGGLGIANEKKMGLQIGGFRGVLLCSRNLMDQNSSRPRVAWFSIAPHV